MKDSIQREKRHRWPCWVLVFLFLVSGCSIGGDAVRQTLANANHEIVIGSAWPFSVQGDDFGNGLDLAVETINSSGGVLGKPIRLWKQDDRASVTEGLAVAQSFADDPQVAAVIGHRNSFVSIPASSIYENHRLLMLSPTSSAPGLTENGYRFVFRSIPSDNEIAGHLADYARRQGYRRMVICYVDDEYGKGLADAFEDRAEQSGIRIVDRVTFLGDGQTLAMLGEKWEAFDYDAIFVADGIPGGAELIADLRQAGIKVPILGGNALDNAELIRSGGAYAENTVVGTVFDADETRREVAEFIRAYEAKYDKHPGQYAAHGYNAVMLLVHAMELAGTTDSAEVAEAIRGLADWPGVTGYHTFNEHGDNIGEMVVIKKVEKGSFVPVYR